MYKDQWLIYVCLLIGEWLRLISLWFSFLIRSVELWLLLLHHFEVFINLQVSLVCLVIFVVYFSIWFFWITFISNYIPRVISLHFLLIMNAKSQKILWFNKPEVLHTIPFLHRDFDFFPLPLLKLFFQFWVLRFEPRALCMLGKNFITGLDSKLCLKKNISLLAASHRVAHAGLELSIFLSQPSKWQTCGSVCH